MEDDGIRMRELVSRMARLRGPVEPSEGCSDNATKRKDKDEKSGSRKGGSRGEARGERGGGARGSERNPKESGSGRLSRLDYF